MYTSLKNPLGRFGISYAERAAFFAAVSYATTKDPEEATNVYFNAYAPNKVHYLTNDDNVAYCIEGDYDIIISFRGTSSKNPETYIEDITAALLGADRSKGNTQGFYEATEHLWKLIKPLLCTLPKEKSLWLVGHSLGGAMALITTLKLLEDKTLPQVREIYTFGCPRAVQEEERDILEKNNIIHHRWVNNADVVPTLPPKFEGYHHHGEQWYLNYWGNVRTLTLWQRIKDQWRGILGGLKHGRLNPITDHLIKNYSERLEMYAKGQEFPQDKL